jgi:hypothetical protein
MWSRTSPFWTALECAGRLKAHRRCRKNPEGGSARPLQKVDDADRSRQNQPEAMTAKLAIGQRDEGYEDGARQPG